MLEDVQKEDQVGPGGPLIHISMPDMPVRVSQTDQIINIVLMVDINLSHILNKDSLLRALPDPEIVLRNIKQIPNFFIVNFDDRNLKK